MNYQEFISETKKKLEKKVEKEGKKVKHDKMIKPNNVVLEYLSITGDGVEMSPTIYMEYWYDVYLNGESIETITEAILRVNDIYACRPKIGIESIDNFEDVADKLTMKVFNSKMNKKMLEDCPHIDVFDLSIVFCVTVIVEEKHVYSVRVDNSILDKWGIDVETLYERVKKSGKNVLGVVVDSMSNMFDGLFPESEIFVLSNDSLSFGAATMFYDGVLEEVADAINDDYYILPSSIHEVLIIPARACDDSGVYFNSMIKEINQSIEENIVLTDHAFYYSRRNGLSSI